MDKKQTWTENCKYASYPKIHVAKVVAATFREGFLALSLRGTDRKEVQVLAMRPPQIVFGSWSQRSEWLRQQNDNDLTSYVGDTALRQQG